jgi:hypothetical protein
VSVRIMSAAWAVDLPAGEKLVLIALADCANDEGHCWPGMASLIRKTGKAERSLQGAIKKLCAHGHLTREEVPGKGCNYLVHPQQELPLAAPAENAPRKKCAPQKTARTPAKSAGKPSRTVIGIEANASIPKPWALPAGVSLQVWEDFQTNRRRKRLPNTVTAWKSFNDDLDRVSRKTGIPPPELIRQCTAKGWGGIYDPRKRNDGQQRTDGMGRNQSGDGLSSTARAGLAVFGADEARH